MSLVKDTLNEMFSYENGKLYWKVARGGKKVGEEAGGKHHSGYIHISLNGKKHAAHRIIYVMHYGHIPQRCEIDHINGIKDDNRIDNLRAVTHSDNTKNTPKATGYSKNKSGTYQARIQVNGTSLYLGSYKTKEEAREVYLKAKQQHHIIEEVK